MNRDRAVLRGEHQLPATAVQTDWTVVGLGLDIAGGFAYRDRPVRGARLHGALHVTHADRTVGCFQRQVRMPWSLHHEEYVPFTTRGAGDAGRAVLVTEHHLAEHARIFRWSDLAGLHQVFTALPPLHANAGVRRRAYSQRGAGKRDGDLLLGARHLTVVGAHIDLAAIQASSLANHRTR